MLRVHIWHMLSDASKKQIFEWLIGGTFPKMVVTILWCRLATGALEVVLPESAGLHRLGPNSAHDERTAARVVPSNVSGLTDRRVFVPTTG